MVAANVPMTIRTELFAFLLSPLADILTVLNNFTNLQIKIYSIIIIM